MTRRNHLWVSAAALLFAISFSAEAQGSKSFTAARTVDGDPDLRGIWEVHSLANWGLEGHPTQNGVAAAKSVVVDPADGKIPYRPEMLTKRKGMKLADDPQAKCYMAGVPRITYTPGPFQIFQSAGLVIIVYQDLHSYRYIPTTGAAQIDGADFWLGSSRGHWGGDTLVVDSVSFNDQTWFDKAANFHSADLRVTERYTLTTPLRMQYEATMEDATTFTKPWTIRLTAERNNEPGFRLLEDECIRSSQGTLFHTLGSAK
jgi:hypothetical protein